MADLTERLNEIETQLAAQHTATQTALTTISSKLDNLGILPSLYADLFEFLGPWASPITSEIPGLLSQINGKLSNIQQALSNWEIREVIDTPLRRAAWVQLGDIHNTIGLKAAGAEFTLASLTRAQLTALNSIYARLAGLDAPWPAEVLHLLECICDATTSAKPPSYTDNNPLGCDEPYASTQMVFSPTLFPGWTESLTFARFTDPLPAGLTYGDFFVIGIDETELVSSDWSEWSVYVESDQPLYSEAIIDFTRYPTNEWRQMSGAGSRSFTVAARGNIKVYLCPYTPAEAPVIAPGDCLQFDQIRSEGTHYVIEIPAYANTHSITFPMVGSVTDSLDNVHVLNYGIPWFQEDTGPGPWVVRMGDNRFDLPSTAYAIVCNTEPV